MRKSLLLVALMYGLFASVFVVGKVALSVSPPFFLTGIRMLVAAGLILGYLRWKGPLTFPGVWWKNPRLWAVGFFNVFVTNAFEFWGLQHMSSAKTCLIYSLQPFVSIGLSYYMLGEKMSRNKWIGLMIGLTGFVPLFLTADTAEVELPGLGFLSLAECAVIFAAFSSVLGWVFVKQLVVHHKASVLMVNGLSFLMGGLFSLASALVLESPKTWVSDPKIFGATLLYIAVIHNVICYHLYANSLKQFSVTFMSFAGILNPAFTAIFAWIFLGEEVGLAFFISLSLIFFGLWLFSESEKKSAS